MLTKIKEFFLGKPKTPVVEAPYKVETPATDWPFPKATEIAPVVEPAPDKKPRAPAKPKATPVVKPAVAAKKPRARKTPAK